jgi:hypothetical protein
MPAPALPGNAKKDARHSSLTLRAARTVGSVWIAALVAFAAGVYLGMRIGGWRAVLRVSQLAHRDLMTRAGLRSRR